jgi:predicted nucleotidyltransferase
MRNKIATATKTQSSRKPRAAREHRATYRAPRRFYWLPVTDAKIRQAAQKIADAAHPEKIILFGSYAYGKPTDDSDVDFFVVMKSRKRIHKRMMDLSEILHPHPFPMDIITRTPAELKKRLEMGDCFFKEIVSKGKVLYERRTD